MNYLIGQRVILSSFEIGTVEIPPAGHERNSPNNDKQLWVKSPAKGYASYYDASNVQPLPNGQL